MTVGNFFEHWEREVLSGETTRSLWSMLLNAHFKAKTEEESRMAIDAWAKEKGILLTWERTMNPAGRPDYWVHFLVLR